MKTIEPIKVLYKLEQDGFEIVRSLPYGFKVGQRLKLKSTDGWWKIISAEKRKTREEKEQGLLSGMTFLD